MIYTKQRDVSGGKMKYIKKLIPLLTLGLILTGCSSTPAEEDVTPAGVTGDINVYTRDASSGTRGAFEEIIGFEGELTVNAIEVSGNGDMAVKVGEDTNAIGYASLTTDFAANNVKALQFEGVDATQENVVAGDYTLARPFSYVTRATGDFASTEQEEVVLAFIAYMTMSVEGLEVVEGAGGIVSYDNALNWDDLKADYPIATTDLSAYTISTGGSTSVEKAVKAALESFQALTGVQFTMDQTGSGDGFKRTLGEEKDGANAADIGFASRDFKDTETVADGAINGVMCKDGIAVIVEINNPLTSITQAQVYDVFTGALSSWEELQ